MKRNSKDQSNILQPSKSNKKGYSRPKIGSKNKKDQDYKTEIDHITSIINRKIWNQKIKYNIFNINNNNKFVLSLLDLLLYESEDLQLLAFDILYKHFS